MMIKKSVGFLFFLLFLGIPFDNFKMTIFRPFSRSLLHRFQDRVPFDLTVPPFFEKHLHFYPSDALILLIFALILLLYRPSFKTIFWSSPTRFLTLFIIFCITSLLFSHYATYYTQYFHLIHFTVMFFAFLSAFLFFQDQKNLLPFFWLLVCVATLESLLSLYQFLFQRPLGLFMLGELPLHIKGPHVSIVHVTQFARKIFEFLHILDPQQKNLIRCSGTFMHPNILGQFLALSLMISYFLFIQIKKQLLQKVLICSIILQFASLCFSFSRSGLLAWIGGTVIWFYFVYSKGLLLNDQEKGRFRVLTYLSMGAFFLSLIVLFSRFFEGVFFSKTSNIAYSDQIRLIYQNVALAMIKAHPLTGLGYNCFVIAPNEFFPIESRSWTHSIYLLLASETGLLGLGAFLLFITSILFISLKRLFNLEVLTLLSIFVGFLCVGFFDFYFMVVQSGKLMFFLFAGLLAAQCVTKASFLPVFSSEK